MVIDANNRIALLNIKFILIVIFTIEVLSSNLFIGNWLKILSDQQ